MISELLLLAVKLLNLVILYLWVLFVFFLYMYVLGFCNYAVPGFCFSVFDWVFNLFFSFSPSI